MNPPADPDISSDPRKPPLKNTRFHHISRSAAKRESVQMLGSIKDLQQHFARAGLVEHKPGRGVSLRGLTAVGEDEQNQPSDLQDRRERARKERERRPWKEVDFQRIDVDGARREAKGVLITVRGTWGLTLVASSSSSTIRVSPTTPERNANRDTRMTLVITARSIRRIRTLALAVSHTANQGTGSRRASTPALHVPRPVRGRSSFSTPSRPAALPRAVSYAVGERRCTLGLEAPLQAKEDTMAELRRAALDVLAGLRSIEESLRTPLNVHSEEEVDRQLSPIGETSETSSSALDVSSTGPNSIRPQSAASGIYSQLETYLDDEEEYSFNSMAQTGEIEHVQTWEERLVSEGREFRSLEEQEDKERSVRESVRKWILTAERVFLVGALEEDVRVEEWAMDSWEGKVLERLHAFLLAHLPLDLQLLLPSPTTDDLANLLPCLSDGYILIQALNSALAFSSKAWGFIPDEDVHRTVTAVGEEGKEWTFRRIENLTCWAAAVRLRYNLPIHMPSHTTSSSFLPVPGGKATTYAGSSPLSTPGASPISEQRPALAESRRSERSPRIDFDPVVIAKRGEGWERTFMDVLGNWVGEAAREARGDV